MAEHIVVRRKLVIGYPNRKTVTFFGHTAVDVATERVFEWVGISTKGTYPKLPPETGVNTSDGIVETSIAVRVRFNVPLSSNGRIRVWTTSIRGPRMLALDAMRDMSGM